MFLSCLSARESNRVKNAVNRPAWLIFIRRWSNCAACQQIGISKEFLWCLNSKIPPRPGNNRQSHLHTSVITPSAVVTGDWLYMKMDQRNSTIIETTPMSSTISQAIQPTSRYEISSPIGYPRIRHLSSEQSLSDCVRVGSNGIRVTSFGSTSGYSEWITVQTGTT